VAWKVDIVITKTFPFFIGSSQVFFKAYKY